MKEGGGDLVATIWRERQQWTLRPGSSLSFGRSQDVAIRVGHSPLDDFVSRCAGSFTVLLDAVLIRNESSSQPLIFRPAAGPQRMIEPQTGMAAFDMDFFRVVVPGRHGREYPISVSVPALRAVIDGSPEVDDPAATRRGSDISSRERRLLAALCEPMLTHAGPGAVHATYSRIALRLKVAPTSVRGALDALRFRLGTEGGIPGLVAAHSDAGAAARDGAQYLEALAVWAVRSRAVTAEVVDEMLPPLGD